MNTFSKTRSVMAALHKHKLARQRQTIHAHLPATKILGKEMRFPSDLLLGAAKLLIQKSFLCAKERNLSKGRMDGNAQSEKATSLGRCGGKAVAEKLFTFGRHFPPNAFMNSNPTSTRNCWPIAAQLVGIKSINLFF